MVSVKKRKNESSNALIFRFKRKMRQSGLMKELRKRRFVTREANKNRVRESALHREAKKEEYLRDRKMGLIKKKKRGRRR